MYVQFDAKWTYIPEHPLYLGGTSHTWGIGIVLGPLVGGGFNESSVGWRWAFYLNLLIGAMSAPVYLFLLSSKEPRLGTRLKERVREVEVVGPVLQMKTLMAFILAISWGGVV